MLFTVLKKTLNKGINNNKENIINGKVNSNSRSLLFFIAKAFNSIAKNILVAKLESFVKRYSSKK